MLTPIEHERAVVNAETADLIRASVSKRTLKNYRSIIKRLEEWLGARVLDDALLADYISMLHHDEGKAPATISQVVAAVSWQSKQAGQQIVGEITLATMAGIRREGTGRGTGQVDGLTWEQVDTVCVFCLNERTIRGLRDASLIRLMSDCLLRVSEAVAVNCGDFGQRTLRIRKIQDGSGGQRHIALCLRRHAGDPLSLSRGGQDRTWCTIPVDTSGRRCNERTIDNSKRTTHHQKAHETSGL